MSAATEYAPAVCIPAAPALDPATRPLARPGDRLATVAVLHPPRDTATAAPLRLTRRGLVVVGLLVGVVAGVLLWLAAGSAPAADDAHGNRAPVPHAVTVREGDTLWAIASRVAPQRDPRAEVADLRRVNQLSGVDLVPGQHLRLR